MDLHGFPIHLVGEGPDWSDILQAIGSSIAAIIAVWALAGDARRRAAADRTRVFVAERAATRLHAFLQQFERELGGGYGTEGFMPKLSSNQASLTLGNGVLRELQRTVGELSPVTMPNPETADAVYELRVVVDGLVGRLEIQAGVPGSESTIDFNNYWPRTQRAWNILQPEAARLRHMPGTRWIHAWFRHRRHAKLERLATRKAD
jgi:hypothetical protein